MTWTFLIQSPSRILHCPILTHFYLVCYFVSRKWKQRSLHIWCICAFFMLICKNEIYKLAQKNTISFVNKGNVKP